RSSWAAGTDRRPSARDARAVDGARAKDRRADGKHSLTGKRRRQRGGDRRAQCIHDAVATSWRPWNYAKNAVGPGAATGGRAKTRAAKGHSPGARVDRQHE